MHDQHDTITIRYHRLPSGNLQDGLAALADAVLLMTATPVLDAALRIVHDRALVAQQQQARRRAIDAQIDALRAQLAALEDQAQEGRL